MIKNFYHLIKKEGDYEAKYLRLEICGGFVVGFPFWGSMDGLFDNG
jgi:hypothetical protein